VLWLRDQTMIAANTAGTTGGVVPPPKERQRADPLDREVRTDIQVDRIIESTTPKMAPRIPKTNAMSSILFSRRPRGSASSRA